jgi:hypothetical protein
MPTEGSLLKGREEKYNGKHGGAQVKAGKPREHVSPFQILLKPMITNWEGRKRFPANNQ